MGNKRKHLDTENNVEHDSVNKKHITEDIKSLKENDETKNKDDSDKKLTKKEKKQRRIERREKERAENELVETANSKPKIVKDLKIVTETKTDKSKIGKKKEKKHNKDSGIDSVPQKKASMENILLKKLAKVKGVNSIVIKPEPDTKTIPVDPEILAMKKIKKEKMRQKKEAKQLNKAKSQQITSEGTGNEKSSSDTAALEYLKQWNSNRDEWKFMKVRQTWLLHNMFDDKLVPDDSFAILLRYLEPMMGKARETTVEKAELVMKDEESREEEDTSLKADRARQIIQLLSD